MIEATTASDWPVAFPESSHIKTQVCYMELDIQFKLIALGPGVTCSISPKSRPQICARIFVVSVICTRPDQPVAGRDAAEGRASGPKEAGSSCVQYQHVSFYPRSRRVHTCPSFIITKDPSLSNMSIGVSR